MKEKTRRNSSIELLKIIAIVIIIISHSVPYGVSYNNYPGFIDINIASKDINVVLLAIIRYFGQIGNAIFVICSSWFLLESNSVNKKKIIKIIFDALVISVCIFLFVKFFFKYDLPKDMYPSYFFPIIHNTFWFITCYLLLYMIHPFLNIIINSITKVTHLKTIIIFLILYSILGLFVNVNLYASPLISFIIIYFVTCFIKKYMKNFNKNISLNLIILFINIIIYVLTIFIINYLSLKYNKNIGLLKYCGFLNPVIMLISICLFNIFSSKRYYNKFINKVSELSLLIYLIHGNYLIMGYCKGRFYNHIFFTYNYKYIVFYTLILSFIYLFGSIIVGSIYQKIMSISFYKIIDKIYNKLTIYINRVLNKISNKVN